MTTPDPSRPAPFLQQLQKAMWTAGGATVLDFEGDELVLTRPGGETRLPRAEVAGARVVRDAGQWMLEIEASGQSLRVQELGADPLRLQSAADRVLSWRQGGPVVLPLRQRLVEHGPSGTTFAARARPPRWLSLALAALLALVVLAAALLASLVDVGSIGRSVLLAVPVWLIITARQRVRDAWTEIQVRERDLIVLTTQIPGPHRSVQLHDILRVETLHDEVLLVLREGSLSLPAPGFAAELAQTIEDRRAQLPAPTPEEEDGRARLAELSRLRERARS